MCSNSSSKPPILQLHRLSKTFLDGRRQLYALKEVSLEVAAGCCVGIVGHNGSGKSTLLRVLAGLTPPSSGYVRLQGQVASVLDIGMGFHPDLNGWDNLQVAARLMGRSKKTLQTRRKAIVDFSGIRKHMDRPLKQYSHGMFLRLAFAVATEVDADILLFDEVLSVGDAAFQQKCRDRLATLKAQGKTLLLVSHNLHQILQFADKYLVLEEGQVQSFGDDPDSISTYVQRAQQTAESHNTRQQTQLLRTLQHQEGIEIAHLSCENRSSPAPVSGFQLHLQLHFLQQQHAPQLVVHVHDFSGQTLYTLSNVGSSGKNMPAGSSCNYNCHCPGSYLQSGSYALSLYFIDQGKVRFHIPQLHTFQIQNSPTIPARLFRGPLRLQHTWQLRHSSTTH